MTLSLFALTDCMSRGKAQLTSFDLGPLAGPVFGFGGVRLVGSGRPIGSRETRGRSPYTTRVFKLPRW